jgi:hypothetical protein
VRERHEITIKAPAGLVLEIARNFDMQSIPMVRAIFWLRAKLLGGRISDVRSAIGLLDEMVRLGWKCSPKNPAISWLQAQSVNPGGLT